MRHWQRQACHPCHSCRSTTTQTYRSCVHTHSHTIACHHKAHHHFSTDPTTFVSKHRTPTEVYLEYNNKCSERQHCFPNNSAAVTADIISCLPSELPRQHQSSPHSRHHLLQPRRCLQHCPPEQHHGNYNLIPPRTSQAAHKVVTPAQLNMFRQPCPDNRRELLRTPARADAPFDVTVVDRKSHQETDQAI